MKVLLITFLATCAAAGSVYSLEARSERSSSEKSFEEKLMEGYNVLKNLPNENDTVKLLEKLHNMEEKIKDRLTQSSEDNDELLKEIKSYTEREKDSIDPVSDTIEQINRNKKVDMALFQGDMILTKEQADEILEDIEENEGGRNKRQAIRDFRYPRSIWSNGVNYAFFNATDAAKTAFRKGAALWSEDTCIDFVENNTAVERIDVIQSDGCFSFVGKIGRTQPFSLGEGCESIGTASHEIGHALGFEHMQSRHDRDDFITLLPENFLDGWLSQYSKLTEHTNYNYNLTYDYGSIMHYGARSVSKNGQPVMVPRDIKYMQTFGSRIISFYDKLMMNLHYKCLDRCNGSSSAACENGGFPHPRDCSKCICPSGYGGRLCNERPSGCGKILTATTSFQTLEAALGEKDENDANNGYRMCNYWIQAPAGSKIEVLFDYFTRGFSNDGCVHGGVEIKTGNDTRYTGYRFCGSEYAGTSFISTHTIVPIITYSEGRKATAILQYRIASNGTEISHTTTRRTRQTRRPISRKTVKPTTRPTLPQATSSAKPSTKPICMDKAVCTSLLKKDFCNSTKYSDNQRRRTCPKSCGFCS